MKKRALFLLMLPLVLSGCLFSINHPAIAPNGDAAVFLGADGRYGLFVENGTLHLLSGADAIPLPAATYAEPGGVLDWSPDGSEVLFTATVSGGLFEPIVSSLYRIAPEPEAQPERLLETDDGIAAASFTSDGKIALLLYGEGGLGALELLDPDTGERERLRSDVLAFHMNPDRETAILVQVEDGGPAALGHVLEWNPRTGARDPIASFVLTEEMMETYVVLPHDLWWDVDPRGRFVALALYDSALLEPAVDVEIPALYLVDREEAAAQRITAMGLCPAFSPDGRHLAYITSRDGDLGFAAVLRLSDRAAVPMPSSEGASTVFWFSDHEVGLTFEDEDDTYRLLRFDLDTGEQTTVFE